MSGLKKIAIYCSRVLRDLGAWETPCPVEGGEAFIGPTTIDCTDGVCNTETSSGEACEFDMGTSTDKGYYLDDLQGDMEIPKGCTATCNGCSAGSDDKYTQIQTDLDAATARWVSQSIVDYKFISKLSCFCLPDYVKAVYLTVLNGRIDSGIFVEDQTKSDSDVLNSHHSIDEQFNLLQNAIDEKAHEIRVEYDEKYGYPTEIYIDYVEIIADEEYAVTNTLLAPITAECGALSYKSYCTDRQFCCNPSCGICAPEGGVCIQTVCL
jgi:hypothetical protein